MGDNYLFVGLALSKYTGTNHVRYTSGLIYAGFSRFIFPHWRYGYLASVCRAVDYMHPYEVRAANLALARFSVVVRR